MVKNKPSSKIYFYMLIIIVIILAGCYFFVNFDRILPAPSVEIRVEERPLKMAYIESFTPSSVTIINTGRESFDLNFEPQVSVGGKKVECNWKDNASVLAPGKESTCFFNGVCEDGQLLKITLPGGWDEILC